MPKESMRLQKFLSECGIASRRKSEELIAAGKVKVNGHPAAIGDKVDPYRDWVSVAGKKVVWQKGNRIYIMLHKPRGYVTTMQDEYGRRCVADLVDEIPEKIYPVGRLDRDSEGMLLLTNDGDFANKMMHPSTHVPKTYRVTIRPPVTQEQLEQMRGGIVIDGVKTLPAQVEILEESPTRVVLEVIISQGRNRQIRKMCQTLGLEVTRLKRTAIGSLKLGMLPAGKWRELEDKEVRMLLTQIKHENRPMPMKRGRK